MKRSIIVTIITLVLFTGCALRSSKIELDKLDIEGLAGDLAEIDTQQIIANTDGLFGELTESKITTYLTGVSIKEYFANEEDLDTFIAIMADLFREAGLRKNRIRKYEIGEVKIEPNGVIAHVEVTYRGYYYLIWSAKVRQVITLHKEEGTWYVKMPKRPIID